MELRDDGGIGDGTCHEEPTYATTESLVRGQNGRAMLRDDEVAVVAVVVEHCDGVLPGEAGHVWRHGEPVVVCLDGATIRPIPVHHDDAMNCLNSAHHDDVRSRPNLGLVLPLCDVAVVVQDVSDTVLGGVVLHEGRLDEVPHVQSDAKVPARVDAAAAAFGQLPCVVLRRPSIHYTGRGLSQFRTQPIV